MAAVLGGIAGFAVGMLQPRNYQSETTLVIATPSRSDYFTVLGDQQAAKAFAQLPKSGPVLAATVKTLGDPKLTATQLATMLTIENTRESQFVTIRIRDTIPERAAVLANELARQTILQSQATQKEEGQSKQFVSETISRLESQIKKLQQELETLQAIPGNTNDERIKQVNQELLNLRGTYATLIGSFNSLNSSQLKVFQEAEIPTRQLGSGPNVLIIIGALVGIIAAIGVITFLEQTDDILRTPAKIVQASGLPTFITVRRLPQSVRQVPALVGPGMKELPPPEVPEAFLTLGAFFRGELANKGTKLNTLLVTSPENRDGKTLTASQIARGLARLGNEVILVDANLRDPGVHTMFGLPNHTGLSTYLNNTEGTPLSDVLVESGEPHLSVLTSGPSVSAPTELLSSVAMNKLLAQLSEKAFVIVDSPAVLSGSEPVVLANKTDAIIMVVDARYTAAGKLKRSLELLTRANQNVLGVVLNRVGNQQ